MSKPKEYKNPLSAERIKECRNARHFSQQKLADLAGVSKQTVYQLESSNGRGLTAATAARLGKALRVSPQYLLGESDAKNEIEEQSLQEEQKERSFQKDVLLFQFLRSCGVTVQRESDYLYAVSFSGSHYDPAPETFFIEPFQLKLLVDLLHGFISDTLRTACRGFDSELNEKLSELQFYHDLPYDLSEKQDIRFSSVLDSWQLDME